MSRQLKPCGSVAAYNRHVRSGETACAPCRAARAEYSREWRRGRANLESAADVRAVRDVLVAVERTFRALGPLALAPPVERLRSRFAERLAALEGAGSR